MSRKRVDEWKHALAHLRKAIACEMASNELIETADIAEQLYSMIERYTEVDLNEIDKHTMNP